MENLPDFGQKGNSNEMMKGSEKNSHFLVISKKNGMKLGIRPFMEVYPDKKAQVIWACLMCRLRVEAIEPDGVLLDVKENFGNLNFSYKGSYASTVCRLEIAAMPVSPRELYEVWQKNQLTNLMIESLEKMLKKTGAKLLVPTETIVEYMDLQYESDIPSVPLVTPEEFKLINI